MAMRITGADCWVKPNPDAVGHDCPLGNGRHIVYHRQKSALWRDLKMLFKQSNFLHGVLPLDM